MFSKYLKNRRLISGILTGAMIVASAYGAHNANTSGLYTVLADGKSTNTTSSDDSNDELTAAQDKKNDAAAKKKEAEAKLSKLESDKEDIMELIEELDSEISNYEEKLDDLKESRNLLQIKSCVSEDSLQVAYIAETNQYENMKERIQFAYENGDTDYIGALISVKEYSNVINQSEYVSQISSYDQKQLNDLMEIEQTIVSYQTEINSNLDEIESLKAEAEGEQQALQVMQSGKQATLEEYNVQIASTEYTIEEMAKLEAEQDSTIAAIEAAAASKRAAAESAAANAAADEAAKKKAAEEEAARKAAEEAAKKTAITASATDASSTTSTTESSTTTTTTTTTATTPTTTTTTNVPAMNSYSGGGFRWPCPSSTYITSSYGSREAPTEGATYFHQGIDIGCSSGASIVAAADGVVSFAGYLGAAGNAVLIDHGNGITTCYFHLSGFNVSEGANVVAGQTIAFAGSTGVSTGPHLHFAVRSYGAYVDPMGYL